MDVVIFHVLLLFLQVSTVIQQKLHVKSCILANTMKCFVEREKILWRLLNIKVALEHFSRFRAIRRNKCDGHTMYESIFIATNVISSSFLEFGTPELDLRHAILMCKIHEKVRFSWWCRTSDANKKFLVGRMNMLWVSKMFSERRGTQRTSNHDRTIPNTYYFCKNAEPPPF